MRTEDVVDILFIIAAFLLFLSVLFSTINNDCFDMFHVYSNYGLIILTILSKIISLVGF